MQFKDSWGPTGVDSWVRGFVIYQNQLNNPSAFNIQGRVMCWVDSGGNSTHDIYYGYINGYNSANLSVIWKPMLLSAKRTVLTPKSPFVNQDQNWCLERIDTGYNIRYFNINIKTNSALTANTVYTVYEGDDLDRYTTNFSSAAYLNAQPIGKFQIWVRDGKSEREVMFQPYQNVDAGSNIYGSLLTIQY